MEQSARGNQSSGLQVISQSESTLTKMRKMIASPRGRRRNPVQSSSSGKLFGASLEDVLRRNPLNEEVPFIVDKICKFIEKNGLDQEGIFRVNGNMKIVEKLKNSFDRNGDADLEESGDIMAVAGLLKLFLRQLAEPVIPEDLHPIFVQAHRDCRDDKPFFTKIIQDLLYRIPNPNYALLKYLCSFLVTIARRSEENKMTPIALAIVFGPNLFRCCEGLEGLRDQAHVNAILAFFIDEFDNLFQERGNYFSATSSFSTTSRPSLGSSLSEDGSPKKQKPARPPPPKFKHSFSTPAGKSSGTFLSPTDEYSPSFSFSDAVEGREENSCTLKEMTNSLPLEPMRSSSPAASIPIPEGDGRQMVESTIRNTVKEHLFGPSFISSSAESDSQISEEIRSPDVNGEGPVSVRDRLKQFEVTLSNEDTVQSVEHLKADSVRYGEKRPKSHAFKMFENSSNQQSSHLDVDKPRDKSTYFNSVTKNLPSTLETEDEDPLSYIETRTAEPLKSLTSNRAQLPKNRRRPSSRRPVSFGGTQNQNQSYQVVYRVLRGSTKPSTPLHILYEGDSHRTPSASIGDSQTQSYVVINKRAMVLRSPRIANDDDRGEIVSPSSSITPTDSFDSPRPSLKLPKDISIGDGKDETTDTRLHVKVSKNRKSRSVENLLESSLQGTHERTRSLSPVNSGYRTASGKMDLTLPNVNSSQWNTEVTPLRPLSPLTIDTTIRSTSRGSPRSPTVKSACKSSEYLLSTGSKHGLLTTVSQDTISPKSPKKEITERRSHPSVDRLKKHVRDQPVVPPLDLFRLQKEEGETEEAQPSPRARFDWVYNDGPVRSPRSPSVSNIMFDSHYDSPPHPPNHHRNPDWLEKRQESVPIIEMTPKELKRRIEALKKIITNFELAFEEKHGRRPRPSDKSPVQKYIAELGRAKKQLREMMDELKDCPELLSEVSVPAGEGTLAPNLRDIQQRNNKATKEETLNGLLKKLQDKRWAAGRPEEMEAMTSDQLADEKLAVQKALLQYESVHGRPSTKEDKTLMRPLYERYRKIKRLIATETIIPSGQSQTERGERKFSDCRDRNSKDLEPIIEGVQFDGFREGENGESTPIKKTEGSGGPLSDRNREDSLNDTFAVTTRPAEPAPDVVRNSGSTGSLDEAVLHEASLNELFEQQKLAKKSKKKLGRTLKNFEDNFYVETGRKVQKEDRLPMETEYRDYKLIKARLRLLEALISKKYPNQTV